MIGWMLGLVGLGGVAGVLALYVLAPAAAAVVFGVLGRVFERLMTVSVPLLLAGLVLLGTSGFLIWRWGVASHGRQVAEASAARLSNEFGETQRKLDACNSSVDQLTISLERQNAAVYALKAESDARMRRAAAALKRAHEQARGLQGKIARLEAAKPASGDLCGSARALIVQTLSEDRR